MDIKMITKAIVAGIMIGLGVISKTMVENSYIGAFLFSLGLLSVFHLQLNLFTGKVGFKEIPWKDKSIIFLGNLIGILAIILCYYGGMPDFILKLQEAAALKFSKSYMLLFLMGIICGILIHIATRAKDNNLITVLCIMTFILIGAEHCIADIPYLIFNFTIFNFLKFGLIVLGNIIGARIIQELI